MMKFAWDNYKLYALGKNELRPLTKNGHIGNMFGESWSRVGAAALGFFKVTRPCPFLSLQRTGMPVVALASFLFPFL